MSISETAQRRKQSVQLRWPGEMTRLGMIAFAILVLHILAASLLLPASSRGPVAPLEDARASSID